MLLPSRSIRMDNDAKPAQSDDSRPIGLPLAGMACVSTLKTLEVLTLRWTSNSRHWGLTRSHMCLQQLLVMLTCANNNALSTNCVGH